jgi:ribosomal protein S18 acetylase RimI-like enzyme
MTDYRIEKITEADIDGFRHAVDIVSREKKYLNFIEAPPLEKSRAFVLDNIAKNYPHFVAHADEKVVGWCDINPKISRPTTIHVGELGIGLLPDYRGRGIGRKLMETTIKAGKEYGLTRIQLGVHADNLNALKLYQSLGFEIEGLHKKSIKIDGVYKDDYTMALIVA